MVELAGRRVYSVSEITGILKGELESAFPDIWVEGEVSQVRRPPSGHLYFTLRESGATLKGVMWSASVRRLRFEVSAGMRVLVRGKLSFYPEGGDLQIYASHMEPSGVGAMMVALEQAKARLVAEGLTDPARRRPIPAFPARVGIVTSEGGAALRDVLSVLRRRRASFDLVLAHSEVQGVGAPAALRAAMGKLARIPGVEVILLTRGGGSLEDLWAFNDEALARDVAACPVPVISAVGHEVDTVLTDLTADLRAATPSVAAEVLTARREAVLSGAREAERLLTGRMGSTLRLLRSRLERAAPGRLGVSLERRWNVAGERLDLYHRRLREGALDLLGELEDRVRRASRAFAPGALASWHGALREGLDAASGLLMRSGPRRLQVARGEAAQLFRLLQSLSPLAVLGRGYAAAFTAGGKLVTSASEVPAGKTLTVVLREGSLACRSEGEGEEGLPPALRRRVDGPADGP